MNNTQMSTNNNRNNADVRKSIFEISRDILSNGPLHRTEFLIELKKHVPNGATMHEDALLGPAYRDAKSAKDDRTFDFNKRIYSLKDAVTNDYDLSQHIARRIPAKQYNEIVTKMTNSDDATNQIPH